MNMTRGCFGCERQAGCKPYTLAQEEAATHCEPLGWIPEPGYRLPDCPLRTSGKEVTEMDKWTESNVMKRSMGRCNKSRRILEKRLNMLAKKAFPVGSTHLCTQWAHHVMVEILAVHAHNNIKVRSATGREYHTRATCLGVEW